RIRRAPCVAELLTLTVVTILRYQPPSDSQTRIMSRLATGRHLAPQPRGGVGAPAGSGPRGPVMPAWNRTVAFALWVSCATGLVWAAPARGQKPPAPIPVPEQLPPPLPAPAQPPPDRAAVRTAPGVLPAPPPGAKPAPPAPPAGAGPTPPLGSDPAALIESGAAAPATPLPLAATYTPGDGITVSMLNETIRL